MEHMSEPRKTGSSSESAGLLSSAEATDVGTMRDEDLLVAAQKEPAVFEILMERYREPLYRAAWKIVKHNEEAEDIVQEAFVKIYKKADKFTKLEGIEFKSWAYKVTINTAITHYRKIRRSAYTVEDPALYQDAEGGGTEAKEISDVVDARAVVGRALDRMPAHLRKVLELYYFKDMSYQSIAEQEGMTIPTLKMRLFRAKKLFRKINDDTLFEP